MKQNSKQLKRKAMKMGSEKNEISNPNAGNKKKKMKETSKIFKNKAFTTLPNESALCRDYHGENLGSEVKTVKETQEFRNKNKDWNETNQGKNLSANKTFLIVDHKEASCNRSSEIANVTHKRCTGSNNWEKFLQGQGKRYVVNKDPDESTEKQKLRTLHFSKNKLTKVIGMDCEMVGAGEDGKDNLLARVSIVNLYGDCLYDKFVKPRETVTDYRTHISGVRVTDLKTADDFESVQNEVAALIKGKILVGHAIKNDLEVLFLSHPKHQIRDTSKFFRKKGCGTPSLKNLAAEYLDVKIQSGEHSSVQDAQAAVQLYNMFRKQWEAGGGNKRLNRIDTSSRL